MIFQKIRKNKATKVIVILFACNLIGQGSMTSYLFALTSGPGQPEMQGPSAVGGPDFVDPFTGDFNYSIPLFEELGIPLTLNYNSGITMDQEASWVGLGWSLNPGAITRTVRGLPDDFNGDKVVDVLNIKDNKTVGVNVGPSLEFLGLNVPGDEDRLNLNLYYNNYNGFGIETSLSSAISAGELGTIGLDLTSQSATSFGNIGVSPKLDLGALTKRLKKNNGYELPLAVGMDINSSEGLKALSLHNASNRWPGKLGYSFGQIFAGQTYSPSIEHNFLNATFTFNAKLGLTAFGSDANLAIGGYCSVQSLKDEEKTKESRAYGYLYATHTNAGTGLQDFNREKDMAMDENSPNLPLAQMTYDIFSVSAPGVSGAFRAYRNDIGYITDQEATVTSISAAGGLEFAGGLFTSPGVDVTATVSNAKSTTWTDGNENTSYLPYLNVRPINSVNENVFFAMMGENTVESDASFLSQFASDEPVEFQAKDYGLGSSLENKLEKQDGTTVPVNSTMLRDGRQNRVKNISYLTKADLDKYYDYESWHEINENAADHHISAIIITTEDGTRYVFGLPAYNIHQKDVNFSIGINTDGETITIDEANNLVEYEGIQASKDNPSGQDNYYNAQTTPPYAHSYLLTEILSQDYVDVTGNGPSDDDLGTYIKYSYGEDEDEDGIYSADNIYLWRTPTVGQSGTPAVPQANHWEGLKYNKADDKANYVYGSKEIWMLNKIETKTHILKFYTSAREDGLGQYEIGLNVTGTENKLKKLDKISLFSKADVLREKSVYDTEYINSVPIKSAHFEYYYTLCNGIPNTALTGEGYKGKLTLNKVYFTYNGSAKGKYNPYAFDYNSTDGTNSYDYDPLAYDRWGNFKPSNGSLKNKDFPYSDQSGATINNDYTSAWCLSTIDLPSGGRIVINYEQDEYAYVQDKQATQMFLVTGVKNHPSDASETNDLYIEGDNNLYIYFKIPKPLSGASYTASEANAYIKSNFILGEDNNPDDPAGVTKNLYFRFLVNTDDTGTGLDITDEGEAEFLKPEYISGYATIDLRSSLNYGAIANGAGNYDKGFIKLNAANVKYKNDAVTDFFTIGEGDYEVSEVNPIAKAGWQFVMTNARYNVLESTPPGEELGAEDIIPMLADAVLFTAVRDIFYDPNKLMRNKGISQKFVPEQSWIRLLNPDGHKYGGGSRVKSVLMYDQWQTMTTDFVGDTEYEAFAQLGKSYTYTLEDGRSSGVAAWEPAIGGDENPFRIPISYNHQDGGYTYDKYLEKPLGESFFPSPVVGYSRVVVQDLNTNDVNRTGTGKTVHEFFTAKDFPVIVKNTTLDPIIHKPGALLTSFFNIGIESQYTASQGYVIEVNDMHGKPKKSTIYPQNSDIALSSTEYKYLLNDDGTLNNEVDFFNDLGQKVTGTMGVTYDVTVDFRKSTTNTIGGGIKYNVDGFPVAAFPGVVMTMWPSMNYSNSFTKISVITKVVNRNGILQEVVNMEDGSFITQKNLVYDQKTGSALLVETNNEYEEPYFSVSYPAHWAYKGMGASYDNDGYTFVVGAAEINPATSEIISSTLKEILTPGDQLYIHANYTDLYPDVYPDPNDKYSLAWVYEDSEGDYYLINAIGEKLNLEEGEDEPSPTGDEGSNLDFIYGKVFRSGKRNLQTGTVQSVVTKTLPIGTYPSLHELNPLGEMLIPDKGATGASTPIIASNASAFSDTWQNFCSENVPPEEFCTCFPTVEGNNFLAVLGNLFEDQKFVNHDVEFENVPIYNENLIASDFDNSYYYGFNTYLRDLLGFDPEADYDGINYRTGVHATITNKQLVALSYTEDGLSTSLMCGPYSSVINYSFSILYKTDTDNDGVYDGSDADFNIDEGEAEAEYIFANPDEIEYSFHFPEDPATCDEINEFYVTLEYIYGGTSKRVIGYCNDIYCIPFGACAMQSGPLAYCPGELGESANPYLLGLLGIWKPKVSYMYKTLREYDGTEHLKDFGTFDDYSAYWYLNEQPGGGSYKWETNSTGWQWTAKAVASDPYIADVESINPLDIYSSATYGNFHTLPEMVSNNAPYKKIGFESFEDDTYIEKYLDLPCYEEHFDFDGTIDSVMAHSGVYSLLLEPEDDTQYAYGLTDHEDTRTAYETPPFILSNEDCLPPFSPDKVSGAQYLLTLWVHENEGATPLFDFEHLELTVKVNTTDATISAPHKSEIIDGWQRQEYIVTIPDLALITDPETIFITFENTGEQNINIDDIRIQPLKALSKTYVYDFRTRRLLAELDENHYTTFYEYDEDGKVIRVKKETERGIMTVQEGKYSTPKR
jgi:hypothetical protein